MATCHEILGSVTLKHRFEVDFDDLVCILSSAIPAINYWGAILDPSDVAYAEAKKSLASRPQFSKEPYLCYEEVLVEGLIKGIFTLDVWDREDDRYFQLTLADIIKGISLYCNDDLFIFNVDEIDGCVADCMIQCACFEEVIYG